MSWKMDWAHRASYGAERGGAAIARGEGDIERAWHHLERAHVVAQPFPVAHVGSHVAMLRLALGLRDRTEMAGQVVRIVVAGPGSLLGRFPLGNTGRANVPLTAEMPIPHDLVDLVGSS